MTLSERNAVAVSAAQLGERLRAARAYLRMTQREVEDLTGIQRPIIGRAESGRHRPSLDFLERLANAYGVTVASLFEVDVAEELQCPSTASTSVP